jgi:CheY-like chemotaxis protein
MSDTDRPGGAEAFSGKRMLVVEDEFLIALDIQRILEGVGVKTVLTASRVKQALELMLSAGPFDAAVLDLKLERETSTPIAERLQQAGVPFVFLTGGPSQADTRRFPQAPVIGKPFDGETLLSALAEAMAAKSGKS